MATAYIAVGEMPPCSHCRAIIPHGVVIVETDCPPASYCPVCAPQCVHPARYAAAIRELVRETLDERTITGGAAGGPHDQRGRAMDCTIRTFGDGTALVLTTDSPASHYGIPILRHTGCSCADCGPADAVCLHAEPQALRDLFGPHTAAETVHRWALLAKPGAQAHGAARLFLSQWPAGPQLRPWTPPEPEDTQGGWIA